MVLLLTAGTSNMLHKRTSHMNQSKAQPTPGFIPVIYLCWPKNSNKLHSVFGFIFCIFFMKRNREWQFCFWGGERFVLWAFVLIQHHFSCNKTYFLVADLRFLFRWPCLSVVTKQKSHGTLQGNNSIYFRMSCGGVAVGEGIEQREAWFSSYTK